MGFGGFFPLFHDKSLTSATPRPALCSDPTERQNEARNPQILNFGRQLQPCEFPALRVPAGGMQLTDGAGIVPDPAALFALLFACGRAAGLVPNSWLALPFHSLLPAFPLFSQNNPSITGLVFSALGPGSAGNAKGGRIPKAAIITRGCCSLFGIVDFIQLGIGALQKPLDQGRCLVSTPTLDSAPRRLGKRQETPQFPAEGMGTGLWRWECGSTEPFSASPPHILAPLVLGVLFHPENPAWSRGGREFVCLLLKAPE